nr:fibrinogen domain-containing type 2 protein 1 [Arenicola marina]
MWVSAPWLLLVSVAVLVATPCGAQRGDADEGVTAAPRETAPRESCSMTITLEPAQVQKVCQGQPQSPAAMVQDLRVQFNQVRTENHAMKSELEAVKNEYQEMVETVKQLKQETASWRHIIEWPVLDEKFKPENESLITKETPTYKDCMDAYNHGERKAGIYALKPEKAIQKFYGFCDEGGWTVIQRRFDGSVSFYKTWDEYTAGFGELSGEFWLGLEHMHLVTDQGNYEFKIEALAWNGKLYYAVNPDFYVASEMDEYRLSVGNMTEGNSVDVLGALDGTQFTAHDRDNDEWHSQNCAQYYRGGWWLQNCGSDPNREWCEGQGCATWGERPVKKMLMKIRPMGSNVPDSAPTPKTKPPPKVKPPKTRDGKPKKVKPPKRG